MGYYIQTEGSHGKTEAILAMEPTAREVTLTEASELVKDETKGIILIVENPLFEAAAFAYDEREFNLFIQPGDLRPKRYLTIDRARAATLSGYQG